MQQQTTRTYELPSGAKVDFEILADEKKAGQRPSSTGVSGQLPLNEVLAPLGEVVGMVFNAVGSIKGPQGLEIELGASIKGGTRLLIVSGEGQASIKVKLTWRLGGVTGPSSAG